MKVSREVIADLLPLYAAGEASRDTCAMVEEFLEQDAELRERVDFKTVENLSAERARGTALPADAELKALRRTRGLLRWQRRLYGWGLTLTLLTLSGFGYIQDGHFVYHLFFREYPQVFAPCVLLAASCWINYFIIRWRLRSAKL